MKPTEIKSNSAYKDRRLSEVGSMHERLFLHAVLGFSFHFNFKALEAPEQVAEKRGFCRLLKKGQMQGARKAATGAYWVVREDRGFSGNAADGPFSAAC